MSEVEFSTFADFEKVKGTIVNMYFIAIENIVNYLDKPDINNQRHAKKAIFHLALTLAPKFNKVLKETDELNYLSAFLANPDAYTQMSNLYDCFILCQQVVEELGITKIETPKVSAWNAYREVE